jgi:hypothetical protein
MRFYCECKSFSFVAILAARTTLSNQKISKTYQRDRLGHHLPLRVVPLGALGYARQRKI